MHWFETQMTNIIVWIPPTPPYIFYPLSPPKNWEEWATDHPLKKLKMHTQLGWATKVLAGDVPGTSNILEILIPRVYTIRFYSILCHITWCSKCIPNWGENYLSYYARKELGRMTMLQFADISTNIVATFAPFGSHSSLWPKATTFERSQWPSLRPSAAIVSCGQRPQQLRGHR